MSISRLTCLKQLKNEANCRHAESAMQVSSEKVSVKLFEQKCQARQSSGSSVAIWNKKRTRMSLRMSPISSRQTRMVELEEWWAKHRVKLGIKVCNTYEKGQVVARAMGKGTPWIFPSHNVLFCLSIVMALSYTLTHIRLCGGAVCPKINTHPKLECGEFDAMEKGRRFCGNKWQIKPKHMWMWWLGGKCKPNISVLV